MNERRVVIYIDVDDTLVRTYGTKRIPMPEVISHVRALYEQGGVLFCWSSGGAAYAQESARELGIEGCFVGFLPKPHVIIDDQKVAEWRYCRTVRPSGCETQSLKDYERSLFEEGR